MTIELRLLGTSSATLAHDSAGTLLAQPKRAALLVYLALAARGQMVGRDLLLAIFWPEADEFHARRALNQALHYLRAELGACVVLTRADDEVGLNANAFTCDALEVRDLIAERRLEEALARYHGSLLPGFHAHASNEFDDWLERERSTFDRDVAAAAAMLSAGACGDGNSAAAIHWARRALDIAPLDERYARLVIGTLIEDGNTAVARIEFDRFARRIRRDLGIEPSPKTAALVGIHTDTRA